MQVERSARVLQAIVIFLAVLIVAALVLVAVTIAGRLSGGEEEAGGFGEVEVALPDGCEIAGTQSDGERLIIRLSGLAERGCRQLLVIDLGSGRLLGRIKAVAAP